MMQAEHPKVAELFERIAFLKRKAVPFEGTVVRSVGTRYASQKIFNSGAGAAKYGGRWNPKGIEAVYASLDLITATYEAYQQFLHFGFPLSAIKPRIMAAAQVRLQFVLDLTKKPVRDQLGFTLSELTGEDWITIQRTGEEAWTQSIGRGGRLASFEALIVPSAQNPGGKNLVVFPGKLRNQSFVQLLAADEMPAEKKY